jgi:hypothetical protein
MFNFKFDTETNPVPIVSNIFGLPDPPRSHPSELNLLPFSPPPFSSSLYFLPITPERVISTHHTQPSPLGLFHNTSQSVSASNNFFDPPLSPHSPAVPVSTHSIVLSPNPLPENESPFVSPTINTSPLPFPFPTSGHSVLPSTHATRNPHLSIQEGRTHIVL